MPDDGAHNGGRHKKEHHEGRDGLSWCYEIGKPGSPCRHSHRGGDDVAARLGFKDMIDAQLSDKAQNVILLLARAQDHHGLAGQVILAQDVIFVFDALVVEVGAALL